MSGLNRRIFFYGTCAILMVLLFRMTSSYTLDETGMVFLLSLPAKQALFEYTRTFPMLSLYEVFMWGWLRVASGSEFVARIPSFVCFIGILIVSERISRDLWVRVREENHVPYLSCVVLAVFPQMQHFATTARAYAPAILFCALSALYFLRWRNSNKRDLLWRSGAWLALAALTKIFAAFQMLVLLPLMFRSSASQQRLRDVFALSLLPLAAIAVQMPLVIYFQRRAALHQFFWPVDFHHFRDLIIDSVFPAEIMVPALLIYLLSALAARGGEILPRRMLFNLFLAAAVVPVAAGLFTWLAGVFLVSEKYVFVAYLPAGILAGTLVSWACRSHVSGPLLALYFTFIGVGSGMTLGADVEDWRRAFSIARNMERDPGPEVKPEGGHQSEHVSVQRAPLLLLSSGLFEGQHQELEGHPFLEAPGRVYPFAGRLLAVPDYVRPLMMEWIKNNLMTAEVSSETRPILFIAKKPSQSKAILLAEMLGRRIAGVEFSQTQVWLLFR